MIKVIELISDDEIPEDITKELEYGIPEEEMKNYRSSRIMELEDAGHYKKEMWDEYIKGVYPSLVPYYEAVRKYLVENHLKKGGFWHEEEGTPVFNDGKIFALSYRAWGTFSAAVWNTEEKERKYDYMDFAWDRLENADAGTNWEYDEEVEAYDEDNDNESPW